MPTTIQAREKLSGSTRLLYDELTLKGANPVILNAASSLIEYTDTNDIKRLLFSIVSEKTSAIGRVVAESKARTAVIATHLAIPVPPAVVCQSVRDAVAFLEQYNCVVTKPRSGSGGRGVTTSITDEAALRKAYAYAKGYDQKAVVQQHIIGADVRLLVIDGKFCSAVIRKPAVVTGDGSATVEQLIVAANSTSPRNNPEFLSVLPIDLAAATRYLGESLHSIPDAGARVRTTGPANVSLGGSLHEATTLVTPAMIADAEKISRRLSLGICGVDMMWNQKTNQHYLIEINVSPGIDIHDDPYSGTSSGAVARYVQWLVA